MTTTFVTFEDKADTEKFNKKLEEFKFQIFSVIKLAFLAGKFSESKGEAYEKLFSLFKNAFGEEIANEIKENPDSFFMKATQDVSSLILELASFILNNNGKIKTYNLEDTMLELLLSEDLQLDNLDELLDKVLLSGKVANA